LPKLIADERYQDLPSMKERKQLFEEFCRSGAGQRSGKAAATAGPQLGSSNAEAKAGFGALLQEATISSRRMGGGSPCSFRGLPTSLSN